MKTATRQNIPDAETLRQTYDYNPDTGHVSRKNGRDAGVPLTHLSADGRRHVMTVSPGVTVSTALIIAAIVGETELGATHIEFKDGNPKNTRRDNMMFTRREPREQNQTKPFNRIDAEYLRSILHYDEVSGRIYWRYSRYLGENKELADEITASRGGACSERCYRLIQVRRDPNVPSDTSNISAHRVAWCLKHGEDPGENKQIDHVNGDGLDNRMCNIRLADGWQNSHNRPTDPTKRKSRYRNVAWHPIARKWTAVFGFKGKSVYLGLFTDEEEARDAVVEAKNRLIGEFARHD